MDYETNDVSVALELQQKCQTKEIEPMLLSMFKTNMFLLFFCFFLWLFIAQTKYNDGIIGIMITWHD